MVSGCGHAGDGRADAPARLLRRRNPDMRKSYLVSGYAEDAFQKHLPTDGSQFDFLANSFTLPKQIRREGQGHDGGLTSGNAILRRILFYGRHRAEAPLCCATTEPLLQITVMRRSRAVRDRRARDALQACHHSRAVIVYATNYSASRRGGGAATRAVLRGSG